VAITPYLLYEDAGAAVSWLTQAFGVRRLRRPMTGPDGKVAHADLSFGDSAFMLGGPAPGHQNPKRLGQATLLLYVDVPDVEKIFERAVKAGAKVIERPTDTPYGARRCAVEDPEGHQWWFARPLEKAKRGKTATKTARKTATNTRRKKKKKK
jgi:PhnB protein